MMHDLCMKAYVSLSIGPLVCEQMHLSALQSPEGDARIMEGSAVRMRIVGFRVDQREMVRVSCVLAFCQNSQRLKCVPCLPAVLRWQPKR